MNAAENTRPAAADPAANQPSAPGLARAGVDLSVIVPTFNEKDNIHELIGRLIACLEGRSWEVIFVDDNSPDGTAEVVRRYARLDSRIRCVQRIGRRGLSSACVEGMLASAAPFLAVMDADLQHDERLLPRMLDLLEHRELDVVVASRYVEGGGIGDWDAGRARMSRIGTRLSRVLVPAELRDPMSGFFMLRREVLEGALDRLSAIGFKILADLFASSPRPLRFEELGYRFGLRHAGESKLDSATAWDYALLLLDKLLGRWVPVRFLAFSIVGAIGVGVHFSVLTLAYRGVHEPFLRAQTEATLVAMTFNFAVNNVLTYRDRRLTGWRWVRGWIMFVLACGVGLFANLGVAGMIIDRGFSWALAAIAGIIVGAVWNYAVTMFLTWGRGRR